MKYVCVHGHFYQPSRENPWLEAIEPNVWVFPYHDWNDYITARCYGPNSAARLFDEEGRVFETLNNYGWISFDFGPTLLSFLERHHPGVYRAILEADRESVERFGGHGCALAQAYNHMIMPLANSRDKRTQIRWGIRDFEHRFGRKPEGMWLPETAVDLETLDAMAREGIRFTILSPRQAKAVRWVEGGREWVEVKEGNLDTTMPYLCRLPSGREISIFFYNEPLSIEISFGDLLVDGNKLAETLLGRFSSSDRPQLINLVTDGETFGHHKPFGELGLARCIWSLRSNPSVRLTVYGEFLENHPPTHEVQVLENTSWGCAHGVERWRRDCGCRTRVHPSWNQRWRAPLREAMEWLGERLASIFESEASKLVSNPWEVRDDYIEVILDRSRVDDFLEGHAKRGLGPEEKRRLLALLELQRHAMLMFTSCGWFFEDISELSTVQVLWHADRAMELAELVSEADLRERFLSILAGAQSNVSEFGDGRKVYELLVVPSRVDFSRVAATWVALQLAGRAPRNLYHFDVKSDLLFGWNSAGRRGLGCRVRIKSGLWKEEAELIGVAVYHRREGELISACKLGGLVEEGEREVLKSGTLQEVKEVLQRASYRVYSLPDLLKNEVRQIASLLAEGDPERVYDGYLVGSVDFSILRAHGIPPPDAIKSKEEFARNHRIASVLERGSAEEVRKTASTISREQGVVDRKWLGWVASSRMNALLSEALADPYRPERWDLVSAFLSAVVPLNLELHTWEAQRSILRVGRELVRSVERKTVKRDEEKRLLESFGRVANLLGVRFK